MTTVQLTNREIEILDLAADGRTYKEIGFLLGIAESTVVNQIQNLKQKLGATNIVHAISISIKAKIIK